MKKYNNMTILWLVILIVISLSTAYGWFLQNSSAGVTGLSAKVEGWNIIFGENNTTNGTVSLALNEPIYPGMETREIEVPISNNGSMNAELDCSIKKITLFNKYEVNISNAEPTPFVVEIDYDENILGGSQGNCTIKFSWPFDSTTGEQYTLKNKQTGQMENYTKDSFDTLLANTALSWELTNGKMVEIEVELIAKQA